MYSAFSRLLKPLTHFEDLPEHLPWVADQCVPGLIKTLAAGHKLKAEMTELAYRIHAYLCTNLGEALTSTGVADALKINRNQLYHLMQQHFGQSFKTYVTRLRIEQAKELLADETVKLKDIANILGYSNKAHFSNAFRQCTGQPPSLYRAALKKKLRF